MIDWIGMGNFFWLKREASGYTQEKVAEIVNVSVRTIRNVEQGTRRTDFLTICRLCDLYDISLQAIERFYHRSSVMEYTLIMYRTSLKNEVKQKSNTL